ncbi:MAG: hypothetical protein DHS80DRAFT_30354 [Piptocephalis tieghemiana]|nr:MAG: hypothetical protein DHS80DRAFT_30354 [Piptocephalis tieghemiana]
MPTPVRTPRSRPVSISESISALAIHRTTSPDPSSPTGTTTSSTPFGQSSSGPRRSSAVDMAMSVLPTESQGRQVWDSILKEVRGSGKFIVKDIIARSGTFVLSTAPSAEWENPTFRDFAYFPTSAEMIEVAKGKFGPYLNEINPPSPTFLTSAAGHTILLLRDQVAMFTDEGSAQLSTASLLSPTAEYQVQGVSIPCIIHGPPLPYSILSPKRFSSLSLSSFRLQKDVNGKYMDPSSPAPPLSPASVTASFSSSDRSDMTVVKEPRSSSPSPSTTSSVASTTPATSTHGRDAKAVDEARRILEGGLRTSSTVDSTSTTTSSSSSSSSTEHTLDEKDHSSSPDQEKDQVTRDAPPAPEATTITTPPPIDAPTRSSTIASVAMPEPPKEGIAQAVTWADLVGYLDSFIREFGRSCRRKDPPRSPEKCSEEYQMFLNTIATTLATMPSIPGEMELDGTIEWIEEYLCMELYPSIFSPMMSDDRPRDQLLESRIAALNMLHLGLEHLGIPASFADSPIMEKLIEDCNDQLIIIDQMKTPASKLQAILRCHQIIARAISDAPPPPPSPPPKDPKDPKASLGLKSLDPKPKDPSPPSSPSSSSSDLTSSVTSPPRSSSKRASMLPGPTPSSPVPQRTSSRPMSMILPRSSSHVPPPTEDTTPSPKRSPSPKPVRPSSSRTPPPLSEEMFSRRVVGADDMLPLLIYMVVRSNPPRLISNLRFIQRYRLKSRLNEEMAYSFTNLMAVISFLETCDLQAIGLSMSPTTSFPLISAEGPTSPRPAPSTFSSLKGESSSLARSTSGSSSTSSSSGYRPLSEAMKSGREAAGDMMGGGLTRARSGVASVGRMFGRFMSKTPSSSSTASSHSSNTTSSSSPSPSPSSTKPPVPAKDEVDSMKSAVERLESVLAKDLAAGGSSSASGPASTTTSSTPLDSGKQESLYALVATQAPPMSLFTECNSIHDLRIAEMDTLLADYQRLARILEALQKSANAALAHDDDATPSSSMIPE